ncbi:protein RRP6-like 2 [Sesamum indicum]|uniref:Protein RRP6-like 2 n=1 Tax=Sesamum indicum TaxID=4182 RepID=A0A6I9U983_SESIN|nr:protein RRP6-like 2 [Sesamum indicum]
MEVDQSEEDNARKSDVLRNLSTKGPLPTSMAKLSGSSRIIPSQKDFYFYNNFQEFKKPLQEIDEKSKNMLKEVGASENLFGKAIPLPDDKDVELDDDVALDWLVNVNDEIFERIDVSLDDFKRLRNKEEESGVRMMKVDGDDDENGFQMVYGKKNKKMPVGLDRNEEGGEKGVQEVKVAAKVRPKVPFHIPTIPRPQDELKIIVNNSNQPFEHVWLQRSEDGSRFIHPLENLSVIDFVDKPDSAVEPVKPLPIEVTPFKLVEDLKGLKQLAIKLRNVDEFAVDLEHNQYRSFQGLTCLMQISTRTEDFVIDTLRLRVQIGPHLREVFKDPTKRKVLHGADRDIMWLQRDFGIYVCNMFDTGQASRVLKMERHSLEYLLNHFCGVVANKEYQNADWRIRPLPQEMIKYAREDTHYLLYIYDLMRTKLLASSVDAESADPPLVEVYKRSYDLCTQLYEKELLTDTSYLHIYGLQCAELNAQQLAVVSGLCEWRDAVARAEDESTGYVLPNRTLIEIAKQMPLTTSQLRRVLKSKLPYIDRNLGSVISIIRHSIQNAAAFEEAAKHLKERRLEMANEENTLAAVESEELPSEAPEILKNAEGADNIPNESLLNDPSVQKMPASIQSRDTGSCNAGAATDISRISCLSPKEKVNEKGKIGDQTSNVQNAVLHMDGDLDAHTKLNSSHSAEATVQILKKPSRAFGSLLGTSAKRKFDPDKREKDDTKLEQIKSTVTLPFHTFLGRDERLQSEVEESVGILEVPHQGNVSIPATSSTVEDIIILDDDSDVEESANANSAAAPNDQLKQLRNSETGTASEIQEGDEPMSLSDLSSSFQKCFPSADQSMSSKVVDKSQPSEGFLQVKPFDYEAARKQIIFGEDPKTEPTAEDDDNLRRRDRKKGPVLGQSPEDEGTTDLPQGRRRQAFPASGNRSATFR